MVPLAEALRMTFRRAGALESAARSLEFKVRLRPLLMTATVCVPARPSSPGPTRKYRTRGMTILKFTCAIALEAVLAVPDSIRDSGTAISGSSNAAPVIKPLNARCHFTMSSLCPPDRQSTSKLSTRGRGTLMIISGTAQSAEVRLGGHNMAVVLTAGTEREEGDHGGTSRGIDCRSFVGIGRTMSKSPGRIHRGVGPRRRHRHACRRVQRRLARIHRSGGSAHHRRRSASGQSL